MLGLKNKSRHIVLIIQQLTIPNMTSLISSTTTTTPGDTLGFRLNTFAGVRGLNFDRTLRITLTEEQNTTFDLFSKQVDVEMTRISTTTNEINLARYWQRPDSFTKLRFLQADKWNVEAALYRLSRTVVFRQQYGLDDFISSPDVKLLEKYEAIRARRFVGFDKQGRPIILERLGELFSEKDVLKGMSESEFILCSAYWLCFISNKIREAYEKGRTAGFQHRFSYIGDLQNTSYIRTVSNYSLFRRLSSGISWFFPELCGCIVLIRAPYVAAKVFDSLVKPYIDKTTAARIVLVNGEGIKELDESIGVNFLPKEFGGENEFELPHIVKMV
jgi:hypothetical protein